MLHGGGDGKLTVGFGLVADEIGVPRPSYERIRCLVRDHRRQPISPGIGEVLLDITLQNRPPEPIIDIHQHVGYMDRPDDVLLAHHELRLASNRLKLSSPMN